MNNFRCDICGQFIAYKDFEDGRAVQYQLTPDSFCTFESYETYHLVCDDRLGIGNDANTRIKT